MEASLPSGATKHTPETVRALHETVLALRTALEGSRKELSELRSRYKDERRMTGSMDSGDEATGNGNKQEEEDIDDIELVFTTAETDRSAMDEDMVPIRDSRKLQRIIEADISKCGVADETDQLSRRNTLPDPMPYRPMIHREVLAAARAGSPRRAAPPSARQETGAQTDITAVPAQWKSETYLAHKISCNLTTLPSKFTLPVPRVSLPLSEKSRGARRVLLSDINFTSKVPELSRSADHLHEEIAYPDVKIYESDKETGRQGSRSSWGSHCRTSAMSIAEELRRYSWRSPVCCHVRHSWSSFACHHLPAPGHPPGRSLPDLRPEYDSGDSTDSLIDEAEEYVRRSIDSMFLSRGCKNVAKRISESEFAVGFEPPKTAQPFLPKTPLDLKRDYLVKVIAADGRIVVGRVRYSGEVAGKDEPHVGVELQTNCGGCDGTFLNHRYFDCKPDHAIFVPFKKVVLAWCT